MSFSCLIFETFCFNLIFVLDMSQRQNVLIAIILYTTHLKIVRKRKLWKALFRFTSINKLQSLVALITDMAVIWRCRPHALWEHF